MVGCRKSNQQKLGDMHVCTDNPNRRGGYLLLEVVLAMGLAAALLTGIFVIADGTLSIADKIVTEGRSQTRGESFLSFLGRNFEELPGNAIVELKTQETSARFLPTLTIQNAPASFSFAGQPLSAEAIVLRTVPVPSGGVNVVIDYYEEQILDDDDGLAQEQQEPIGSIILYRDLWYFELRALDIRTQEWVSDWEIRGRLPLQIEMNAVFEPNGDEVVHYFWLPAKENPATLVRSLSTGRQGGANRNQRGNQGGAASGGDQGGPGGGGNRGSGGEGPAIPGVRGQ